MKMLKALAAVAALSFSGAAYAQGTDNPVLVGGPGAPELTGPDDSRERMDNATTEATRNANRTRQAPRGNRAVPATPEDFTVGAEVRDSRGAVIGKVAEVGMGSAVIEATGGKVSVPFESFGRNRNGLLISLTKEQFDALVAQANQAGG